MTRTRRRWCRATCRLHRVRCELRRGHFDLHEHTDEYCLHRWDFSRSWPLRRRDRRQLRQFFESAQGKGD